MANLIKITVNFIYLLLGFIDSLYFKLNCVQPIRHNCEFFHLFHSTYSSRNFQFIFRALKFIEKVNLK